MSNANRELYEFDKFRLDVAERLLSREGERVPIPEKAFETLCALVRRGNALVGKEELLNEIWAHAIVEENNIDKNISLLRQVLGERSGKGKFIETVRGHGFRFVPEVRPILNSAVGIADTKPEETVSENESDKTENQIARKRQNLSRISGCLIPLRQVRISKRGFTRKPSLNHAKNSNFPAETTFHSAHMRWQNRANEPRRERR